jgi:carboxymethylenebutenolidase
MGEVIEIASNGGTVPAYLAEPEGGSGPGVVVIQEWWGLVPHIEDVCDRFAAEGFVALAPDLYHGERTTEPDEAGKLMMGLRLDEAVKDMSGAVDALLERAEGHQVGVVGFCMGGGLALILAANRPDAVGACAPFYGAIPWEGREPDWSELAAAVQMHVGDKDAWAMGFAGDLEPKLVDLGKQIEVFHYEGAEHAFFNDARPEVYHDESARLAFERTTGFLREHLAPGEPDEEEE